MKGKKYYFVDGVSGKVSGPNYLEELKVFQFENRISGETQVTEEGRENWMSFEAVLKLGDEVKEPDIEQSPAEASVPKIMVSKSSADHSARKPVDKAGNEVSGRPGWRRIAGDEEEDEKQGVAKRLFENVVSIKGQLWIMILVLAVGFGLPVFSFLAPRPKWEYETVSVSGSYIALEKINNMGSLGWELVDSFVEIETTHPNFGDSKYVTGIRPDTHTTGLNLIFKRRKAGW